MIVVDLAGWVLAEERVFEVCKEIPDSAIDDIGSWRRLYKIFPSGMHGLRGTVTFHLTGQGILSHQVRTHYSLIYFIRPAPICETLRECIKRFQSYPIREGHAIPPAFPCQRNYLYH